MPKSISSIVAVLLLASAMPASAGSTTIFCSGKVDCGMLANVCHNNGFDATTAFHSWSEGGHVAGYCVIQN